MSNSIVMQFELLKTINAGQIQNGYNPIYDSNNNAYFLNPCRMLLVNNMTNAPLMFSNDGVNDKFSVPANTSIIFDFCTNKTVQEGAFVTEDTRLFVKTRYTGVFPTSGDVDVTVIYGEDY